MAETNERLGHISFDDEFIQGYCKALQLLDEFGLHEVFYVVTCWVQSSQMPSVPEIFNKGREHADSYKWLGIQANGHEMCSHTVTRLNAGHYLRW